MLPSRRPQAAGRPTLRIPWLLLGMLLLLQVLVTVGQPSATKLMAIRCDSITAGNQEKAPSVYGLTDCYYATMCVNQPVSSDLLAPPVTPKPAPSANAAPSPPNSSSDSSLSTPQEATPPKRNDTEVTMEIRASDTLTEALKTETPGTKTSQVEGQAAIPDGAAVSATANEAEAKRKLVMAGVAEIGFIRLCSREHVCQKCGPANVIPRCQCYVVMYDPQTDPDYYLN